jgi:peptidoglycan/LPS O-acetylase OafA/YrhL
LDLAANITAPTQQESQKAAGRQFYRPELDVLRFVAFLSVFTAHAFTVSPDTIPGQRIVGPVGACGLCLFFFLSSYLITELLCREHLSAGKVHVQAFYLRRMLRIWPLYFAFLLFGKIIGHMYPFFSLGSYRLLAFIFLAGNWYQARFGLSWSPVEPLWSISLEEQFYLIWPIMARFGGRRALGAFSAVLLPVAWASLYWHSGYQPGVMGLGFDGTIWRNSLVQFQFFALGALFAIFLRGRIMRWNALIRGTVFGSGFLLWLAASWLFRLNRFHDRLPGGVLLVEYSLIAAGCILLFLSLLGASKRLPKFIIYLGKISYGLYVYHWLFLELVYVVPHTSAGEFIAPHNSIASFVAKYLLSLAATVLIAVFSYRYFERPFLELKKRFTFVVSRTI